MNPAETPSSCDSGYRPDPWEKRPRSHDGRRWRRRPANQVTMITPYTAAPRPAPPGLPLLRSGRADHNRSSGGRVRRDPVTDLARARAQTAGSSLMLIRLDGSHAENVSEA